MRRRSKMSLTTASVVAALAATALTLIAFMEAASVVVVGDSSISNSGENYGTNTTTTAIIIELNKGRGTVERLSPTSNPAFSFVANSSYPVKRTMPGCHHVGDVTLSTRQLNGTSPGPLPNNHYYRLCGSSNSNQTTIPAASTIGGKFPLYVRHASFVAFVTPVETQLDRDDSAFRAVTALADVKSLTQTQAESQTQSQIQTSTATAVPATATATATAVSFESKDFPGRYLLRDDTQGGRLAVQSVSTMAQRGAATFLIRPGALSGTVKLEAVDRPGAFITTWNQTDIKRPGFCHYKVCVPVYVASCPNGTESSSCAAKSSWALDLAQNVPAGTGFSEVTTASTVANATLLPTSGAEFWAGDISAQLPGTGLNVERRWSLSADGNNDPILTIVLSNPARVGAAVHVEIGALGVSLPFDQLFSGRSLELIAAECSFTDPYIGDGAGYVQAVSTTGRGPALLVTPANKSSNTRLEAWSLLSTDPQPRGVTFEGYYQWLFHSGAYTAANGKWSGAQFSWNRPSTSVLAPGATISVQLRFSLANSLGDIDKKLTALGLPVVSARPGYVLEADTASTASRKTAGDVTAAGTQLPTMSVTSVPISAGGAGSIVEISVEPEGAISVTPQQHVSTPPSSFSSTMMETTYLYSLNAKIPGPCRVQLKYASGLNQTVSYYVTPGTRASHVAAYSAWVVGRQWLSGSGDPFYRNQAFLNYDRRLNGGTGGLILQNAHSWIAGLSDECGAGPALGVAMKNLFSPAADEVRALDSYVQKTLWGSSTARAANQTVQAGDYGVRASMFYSGLPGFNYTGPTCWDRSRSLTRWRSYNYPHVVAQYWVLYRLARTREASLGLSRPWTWYLAQAANTTLSGMRDHGGYNKYGLMVGSVFRHLLLDLRAEGAVWAPMADAVETFMQERASGWAASVFPFGSEMPWDSTGQEEVYTWCEHFGYINCSRAVLGAVQAYTPKMASWGYHGNARRYFDFLVYGGENEGTERALHHYGAPLNSIPLLEAYRRAPSDTRLLSVGIGALTGTLSLIEPSGSASMGWHGSPARLHPDPTNCDYGVGFYGHTINSGSFLVRSSSSSSSNVINYKDALDGPNNNNTSPSTESPWSCYLCRIISADYDNYDGDYGDEIMDGHESGPSGIAANISVVALVPTDSFTRRIYLQPLGLDILLDAGHFARLRLDLATGRISFDLSSPEPHTRMAHFRLDPLAGPVADLRVISPLKVVPERGGYSVPLNMTGTNTVVLSFAPQ